MNKSVFIVAVIGVFVLIGTVLWLTTYKQGSSRVPTKTTTPTIEPTNPSSSANTEAKEEVTITYTATGFSPAEVTLKNDGKITWVNKSSQEVKIGANPHPTHTGNREVSGGDFTLDLMPGNQKTVGVSKVGIFGYHNHLNAGEGGTIAVE